jgi:uncharacterized protein (TIGR00251 family)
VCAWGRRSSGNEQKLKHRDTEYTEENLRDVAGFPCASLCTSVPPVVVPFNGITFAVKVHPRAKKNAITGEVGDALKLALTAPPVNGKANEACIEFFAKLLNLPRSSVTIAAGQTSRNKVIRVAGLTAQQVRDRLGS